MTFVVILLMGLWHGLQPDHQAAALGLAARTGTSAWRAALRLAVGHAGSLVLLAALLHLLPASLSQRLDGMANALAGTSLLVLGAALLLQVWRAHYVVHAHPHRHSDHEHEHLHTHPVAQAERHEHRHARGALGLGLVLGLGGTRGALMLLPRMTEPGLGLLALGLYCAGVALGGIGVGALVDLVRQRRGMRPVLRWVDCAFGLVALGAGAQLVYGAFA